MYIKITRLFLFLNLITSCLLGQEVFLSGTVVDAADKPIEFANILVQNADNPNQQIGTITELDGRFKMAIGEKSNYKITISFIGLADWQQTINIQESIDVGIIKLQASTNDLDEVIVTADRNIITRKEDKLIFNVATSPLKSGYDGIEVLQRSPNIIIDSEGNITMRNEAPTVMINGRITNLSGADLANYISNLRSDEIKSIEIQTHLSANTDGESSGGVINIILKKKPVGFDASLRADYGIKGGGFNRGFSGGNFNYGAAKWNIYGSYNYLFNESESKVLSKFEYFELQDLITSNEVFVSDFKRQNFNIGFVGDIAKNHVLGIEGFASDVLYDFTNDALVNIFHEDNLIEDGKSLATGQTDSKIGHLTLNYTWKIDTANSNLKVFANYTNQDATRTNTAASTYNQGVYPNLTERNIAPANTLIYSVQSDVEKYFKQGFKLETGAKLTYTDRENTLFSDILVQQDWMPTNRTTSFNYSEKVWAGYAAVNKNFGQKNFIEIGLRVENTDLKRVDLGDESIIEQNYTNWFPAFYYSRDLANNNSLSLSYSKRLRRPPFPFLNNNAIKINDFRYELGNPDLIPENVNNWELSFKGKKQSVDLYLQRTTEAINGIYYLEGQIAYYQKFNEGIQQQIGISYNRFGNLTPWWYIKGLVSIYQRKFINAGGNDSFKRTTARLNFTNNFKINETTSIDLIARYVSPYEDAYYIEYEQFRINVMLQKTFLNKKLNARIYINDLFNTLVFNSERPFDNFKSTRRQTYRSQSLTMRVTYNFNGKNKVNKRKNRLDNEARGRL